MVAILLIIHLEVEIIMEHLVLHRHMVDNMVLLIMQINGTLMLMETMVVVLSSILM